MLAGTKFYLYHTREEAEAAARWKASSGYRGPVRVGEFKVLSFKQGLKKEPK